MGIKLHKWNKSQKKILRLFIFSASLFKSSICLHFHYALCVPEDASTHFEISLKSWTKSNNQMPKTIGHHIKIFYRAQISCDFVCHYDDVIYGDIFNVSHSWPSISDLVPGETIDHRCINSPSKGCYLGNFWCFLFVSSNEPPGFYIEQLERPRSQNTPAAPWLPYYRIIPDSFHSTTKLCCTITHP